MIGNLSHVSTYYLTNKRLFLEFFHTFFFLFNNSVTYKVTVYNEMRIID
nr:MAG TPA: hypothetical protein [Caudoviricetes sp.]